MRRHNGKQTKKDEEDLNEIERRGRERVQRS